MSIWAALILGCFFLVGCFLIQAGLEWIGTCLMAISNQIRAANDTYSVATIRKIRADKLGEIP